MFSIDPKLSYVATRREQIVAVIESVNQPHVAIPGKNPQGVQAYVCGLRNQNATFSIYVYLLLSETKEPVLYVYDQPQFALEAYREAEAEALQFVESMGFMMENLNFRNQSTQIQEDLLGRIPAFAPPAPKPVAAEGAPGGAGADQALDLARLLSAF
ncbi:MAG: hypothetical protein ACYDCL_14030 [Myxococcales bacterium]